MRKNRRDTNRIVIQKIIRYCNEVEIALNRFNNSFETYQADFIFRYACDKCAEQIGELTTRLTDDLKARHEEISWHEIKGLRNIHVHDYESVNFEIMWEILTKDIPTLKAQLEKILAENVTN